LFAVGFALPIFSGKKAHLRNFSLDLGIHGGEKGSAAFSLCFFSGFH
jgi:hypothetical protein